MSSDYASLLQAPELEQDRLITLVESGELEHRSPCPMAGCKGLLEKDVAFCTKEGVSGLFPADVLTCNRKKCDFSIIVQYSEASP